MTTAIVTILILTWAGWGADLVVRRIRQARHEEATWGFRR